MAFSARPAASGGSSGDASPTMPRKLRWVLVTGLVVANLLVLFLSVGSIYQSRSHFEGRAETLTQHIANALEQNISSTIARIDLALDVVVDRLESSSHLADGIDEELMNAFLLRQELHVPEVEGFRVARADGRVILGKGLDKSAGASWAERDFFQYLRDNPEGGLRISKPLKGHVSGQYVVGFVRRYNNPDGSFAGIVSAPVHLSQFNNLLASFDLGSHGALVLRDSDFGLIARVPPLPDTPLGTIGNDRISAEFRSAAESRAPRATFHSSTGGDGHTRISTFRRLSNAPMLVLASVAKEDYLAEWSSEVFRTLGMGTGFLILSLLLGGILFRLIRRAEEDERRVLDTQAFVISVIDSLPEHIAVVDTHGVIIIVNCAWRRFAEANGAAASSSVAVGANYLDVCDQVTGSGEVDAVALSNAVRAVLDGSKQDVSVEYACHSPTLQRWFVLHVVPLQGLLRGAVMIHQNITDRRQADKALEQIRDEELRFKSDFLSHVSHELRSPLTAIKQFTSLLMRGVAGELNAEQRQYQAIVFKNVRQLQSMIDDLLEVTRMETGKLTVIPASVSVDTVATDALNTLEVTASAGEVAISCRLPQDLPLAYADEVRLLQIFIILLDNAVKFTPSGGAIIITGTLLPDDPDFLLLEIADTGCGISPQVADNLFQRLYQVSGDSAASRKGLGLGLFICRELVTRQGGRIWVTSKPGEGSKFSFTLPVYSIRRLLAPLIRNGRWPGNSCALLTLRLSEPESAASTEHRATRTNKMRNFIQQCLRPDLDLLLPAISTVRDELFFVAVFAEEQGRQVLADRITEQFAHSRAHSTSDRTLSISYQLLPPFSRDVGLVHDMPIADMAARLEFAVRSQVLEVVQHE